MPCRVKEEENSILFHGSLIRIRSLDPPVLPLYKYLPISHTWVMSD